MPDRRQVLRALLLAGAGLALPAACGVPSGGRPVVDGNGLPYDPVGGQQGEPPDPSDADSPAKLVELFLEAASGALETSEQQTAAANRARAFLTREATKSWQPDVTKVTVVRVESLTNTTVGRDVTTVACTLLTVGRFDGSRGLVSRGQDVGSAPVTVEFTVVPNADRSGFLISTLPDLALSGLVLSTAALNDLYFTPQLVYFWDTNRRALVPDLRYVPRAGIPASQQRADVVRWLLGGPSELISPVAIKIMPDGADLSLPNVLTESDRLVIDMTGAFQAADLGKVMSELRWSLNPLYLLDSGTIELQIASRPQQVDGTAAPYIADNLADSAYRDVEARPFCVVNGQVYPVESGYSVPPVLANVARQVVYAAVSRDRQQAAFVCVDKNTRRLWLGQGNKAGGASYTESTLTGRTAQSWSRPAFLPSGQRILVIVDGSLYAVTAGVATSVMEGVKAFSVSPDGYRIALIPSAGPGVQVGVVRDTGDRLTLTNLRPLDPGLTDLSAVAWTRLDRVLVSGHTPEGFRLAEVTIDGAIQTPWTGRPFKDAVSWIVAYPTLPSQQAGSGPVLVQTDKGEAFRVFATSDPLPLAIQSSSPRPSPSTAPPPVPTAPFFVD
jgi:hypothetical protein